MFVVAVGDPFDGIELFGTFDSHQSATTYAELMHRGQTWYIIDLIAPLED